MSVNKSLDAVRQLEARLFGYLRIPLPAPRMALGTPQQPVAETGPDLERLRLAVSELERSAARIGAIPSGYPKHVDLVMRLISALLPWYTRSLVTFGRQTAQTAQALSEALADLARRQQELAAALQGPPRTRVAAQARPHISALSKPDGSVAKA